MSEPDKAIAKADATIARIAKRGSLRLSEAEIAALRAAPPTHELAQKMLGAHAFNAGDYAGALHHCQNAYHVSRSPENEANLLSALQRRGKLREAMALIAASPHLEAQTREGRLAELHLRAGDPQAARAHGSRALALKDAGAPPCPDPRPDPVLRAFDPQARGRNIIAYSLFGHNARYHQGALRNAMVVKYLYPSWTPRFYIDASVPKSTRAGLAAQGAQLREVPKLEAGRYGLFWRFLVEDDESVDFYLVRDADAVPNAKEAAAVAAWLGAGQPFHLMRDFPSHAELILAGMWGAQRGNLSGMGRAIMAHVKARASTLNARADDQMFLRDWVWPQMRGRVLQHDSQFEFAGAHPFPEGFDLPEGMHIGQDDSAAPARTMAIGAAGKRADKDTGKGAGKDIGKDGGKNTGKDQGKA